MKSLMKSARRPALGLALTFFAAAALAASPASESDKANAFFERCFQEELAHSPMLEGILGFKKDQDKWDDTSEQARLDALARTTARLAALRRDVRFEALDAQARLSYELFVSQGEQSIEGWRWRDHRYVFSQMGGMHIDAPAFLINFHAIDNVADARAYIARLRGLPQLFEHEEARARAAQAKGILPPKFVFPLMIDASRQIVTGAPFDGSKTVSPLWDDFQTKVGALKGVDAATKTHLLADARAALQDSVKPAYEQLLALFQAQEQVATTDDGVWKLPDGDAYYAYQLRVNTTTDMSAEQIHALGLREVARIHAAMQAIKDQVGFKGDLAAFLKFTRDDPQFIYPDTPEGQAAYVKRATQIIDDMRARLPEFFTVLPKAALVVKKVEPFRQKGSASAFYEPGSIDGKRPGAYYINTYDMRALPIWEMETLAHHEAIPGHHMQISIAQELQNVPKFRKYSDGYTAYVEGWALYCEYFTKAYGFYSDPMQDFGRLSDELLRAVRLVVDTGIHAKHWTRQQVMDYFRANTAESDADLTSETNRYIVWPGQATAYKIGMLKIVELRELAKQELGPKFDIRAFHDLVLKNGPLPMDRLEENVRAWIASTKAGA